jgi:hypothetical protein
MWRHTVRYKNYLFYSLIFTIAFPFAIKSLQAGTRSYDLLELLYSPHPFSLVSNPVTPPIIKLQSPEVQGEKSFSVSSRLPKLANSVPGLVVKSKPRIRKKLAHPETRQQRRSFDQNNPQTDHTGYISFGLGYFDINDNKSTAEFRIERRLNKSLWMTQPFVGVMASGDAAIYGYSGIAFDWMLSNFILTPSFAVGAYLDGDGKDLGHTIEFRSALEIAYKFPDRHRLGLMFYHLSNASLADNNPGTEVLSLSYSIPFN